MDRLLLTALKGEDDLGGYHFLAWESWITLPNNPQRPYNGTSHQSADEYENDSTDEEVEFLPVNFEANP